MGKRTPRLSQSLILTVLLLAASPPVFGAGKQVSLTLGRISEDERVVAGDESGVAKLESGLAWQANFSSKIAGTPLANLDFEMHFLASPSRDVSSGIPSLTRDFATIYLTPGVKVQFLPGGPFRPFVSAGAGLAVYENSRNTIGGDPNPVERITNRGVIQFGGGVDLPVAPHIGMRFEIRDFYSGDPRFNGSVVSSKQHNVIIGGGIFLHF